jgi:hypothetical protein
MPQHEFLKEIYNDFCIKNNLPRGRADYHDDLFGGAYLSAEDYLNSKIGLTLHQKKWLANYIKLWETTNGGEDN